MKNSEYIVNIKDEIKEFRIKCKKDKEKNPNLLLLFRFRLLIHKISNDPISRNLEKSGFFAISKIGIGFGRDEHYMSHIIEDFFTFFHQIEVIPI